MTHILAFGDSFSDNAYCNGCGYNRLSNGKVWVEHLAQMLGATLEDRAWCGAKSGQGNASGPEDWSGLAWQVDTYTPSNSERDVLCTILIGINDVYDGTGKAEEIVANTVSAMSTLEGKGVSHFLISNIPDITLAPAYRKEYAPLKKTVQNLVKNINSQLDMAILGPHGFCKHHPDTAVYPLLNTYALFNELVTSKEFTNTREPWNGTYSNPNTTGYMWWDDWHPMTQTHKTLAHAALKMLETD
nr:SGNH/GDSL hydrolase family protein [uncultured Pseudodesulfovibrio sp.]